MTGLASAEAAARLGRFGPNLLPPAPRPGPLQIVGRQLKNPLAAALLASGALTLALGAPTDGLVVIAVVALNAVIGAMQEQRATRAIEALDALAPEYAVLLRDEEPMRLATADLVPGDVVLLEAGDRLPADMRVLESHGVRVDEASLTGESLPVEKRAQSVPAQTALAERSCMLFSGTHVVAGTGQGIVVATGAATEIGRIAVAVHQAHSPDTPLTRALAKLGKNATQVVCAIAVLVLTVAHRRGFPLLDAVRSAVAFAAAAIPEGLPAVITITLAIAVRRMAGRNSVVRTLPAVEALGSTTVACTDKTGTLTVGEMTVRRLWVEEEIYELSGVGYAPFGTLVHRGETLRHPPRAVMDLLLAGVLCNEAAVRHPDDTHDSATAIGDSTEVALLVAAEKVGISLHDIRAAWPRIDTIPFDSQKKYMVTLHETPTHAQKVITKGAPEVMLRRCNLDATRAAEVAEYVDLLAASGMRVLALAWQDPPRRLDQLSVADLGPATLLGLVGMIDASRPEAIVAISACQRAGIRVKMITGDHPVTARVIGEELGLTAESKRALTGLEISQMSKSELLRAVQEVSIFARVEPEHKLRLVESLQASSEVVAMTGDGVNDAPALRQADIGIAMGKAGTATAREASNIILVDDNFASIAAAVEEGRRCYDNLVKALMFLLPTCVGQSLIVLIGVVFFPLAGTVPLMPLIPVQILWVNFVTGVTLALPLAFEEVEPDVMQRAPRPKNQPLLGRDMIVRCMLVGMVMAAGGIGLFLHDFYGAITVPYPPTAVAQAALRRAQTMVATTVVLFQCFYLVQCRSLRTSILAMNAFSNPAVYAGIALTTAMQIAFVNSSLMNDLFHSHYLGPREWLLSLAVASTVVPIVALHKHSENASHGASG